MASKPPKAIVFGDNPKIRRGNDASSFNRNEPWEVNYRKNRKPKKKRVLVSGYRTRKGKRVKSYIRKKPGRR